MANKDINLFNRNLFVRSCSAAALAPLMLAIVDFGGFIFYLTILVMAILMAFEWQVMLRSGSMKKSSLWQTFAVFYIAIPCSCLIWIMTHNNGSQIITWLLLTIWITDTAAYIFGRSLGGPKLVPKISPNKTWSGLIGGCGCAAIFGYFAARYFATPHQDIMIALTFILALYAQIGDLIESWVKRIFSVKDSGSIIPGHGGILDRVDGIILTAPKVALILMFDQHWRLF